MKTRLIYTLFVMGSIAIVIGAYFKIVPYQYGDMVIAGGLLVELFAGILFMIGIFRIKEERL